MKNKSEREIFLKNYREWERLSNRVPELGLKFYRYVFKNGAAVIVTEYQKTKRSYDGNGNGLVEYTTTKYHLVLPEDDGYNPYDQNSGHSALDFLTYTLEGSGVGTIVDYMTKRRDVI